MRPTAQTQRGRRTERRVKGGWGRDREKGAMKAVGADSTGEKRQQKLFYFRSAVPGRWLTGPPDDSQQVDHATLKQIQDQLQAPSIRVMTANESQCDDLS